MQKVRQRQNHWMYQERAEVAQVTEALVPLETQGNGEGSLERGL